MKESVNYYQLFIIVPCFTLFLLFSFFFLGLSKVDASYNNLNVTQITAQYYGSTATNMGGIGIDNSNGFPYFTQDVIPPKSPSLISPDQLGTVFYSIYIDPVNIKANSHNSFVISYSTNTGLQPSEFIIGSRSYSTSCSVEPSSLPTNYDQTGKPMYYYTCPLEFDWLNTSFDLTTFRIYFNLSGNAENGSIVHFAVRGRMYYYDINNTMQAIDTFKQQSHDDAIAKQKQDEKIAEEQKKRDQEMQNKQDETNEKLDEQNKTSKNIFQKIVELPQTITNLFLNMLKSLFIPSENDLNDIIDKSTKISENFGFVGQSFSFVIRLFTSIVGMVNADGCLMLPELNLKFGGILGMKDYKMWDKQNVCMSDNPWFGKKSEAIEIVRTITTGTLICAFIGWSVSQLNEILSKEDTAV